MISIGLPTIGLTISPAITGVQAFSFNAETTSIASSFSVAPTTARKRTINRLVNRMTALGCSPRSGKWTLFAPHGLDEDASLTNWVDGTKMTKVGSPTHTANVGWVGVTNTGYINTGINASTLDTSDVSLFVWSKVTTAITNFDCGATNASSQGYTLVCRHATNNNIAMRLGSASVSVSPTSDGDGFGLNGGTRSDASNIIGFRNGVQKDTVAAAAITGPNINMFYLTSNGNGTPATTSGRQLSGIFIGKNLTAAQIKGMTGALGEYYDSIQYGEPIIEEQGIGTASISVNCAAYGFTIASVMYCLQAARAGKTVALIGGWRDRWNLGGVVTGGLGFTDFNSLAALGGLPRYLITRTNAIEGTADTAFKGQPKNFKKALLELLNPALNGGFSIPVYQTGGVTLVNKTGAVINSIRTTDGRLITASQWHDGSYEGDLALKAGISYTYGREAAGTGLEANNGVQLSSTNLNFQPWVTANTPASGLIPNVQGVRTTFGGAVDTVGADGTADTHVQSYNFRGTLTNTATRRVPFSSTPPTGYSSANYEFLFRFLAGNATVDTFAELFKTDLLYGVTYDVNNLNFISADYVGGGSDSYPFTNYGAREVIWKNHENYLRGFYYACQYDADARVPSALKTDMANWGFCQDHYYSPHPNDEIFWMPQLYIRETIHIVGLDKLNGADLTAADGGAPRISTNIISMISYNTDSHAVQRVAYEASAGSWQTRNEGGLGIATGDVNGSTPCPVEVVIPAAAQCTNLSVSFVISCTHVGFGAYRMEPTMWQVGQSMGQYAAEAINNASNILQNASYSNVRTSLLASASLSGEVAPVLTQTT